MNVHFTATARDKKLSELLEGLAGYRAARVQDKLLGRMKADGLRAKLNAGKPFPYTEVETEAMRRVFPFRDDYLTGSTCMFGHKLGMMDHAVPLFFTKGNNDVGTELRRTLKGTKRDLNPRDMLVQYLGYAVPTAEAAEAIFEGSKPLGLVPLLDLFGTLADNRDFELPPLHELLGIEPPVDRHMLRRRISLYPHTPDEVAQAAHDRQAETERKQKERLKAEALKRAEAEAQAKAEAAKLEKERLAAEAREREEAERLDREQLEVAARQQAEADKAAAEARTCSRAEADLIEAMAQPPGATVPDAEADLATTPEDHSSEPVAPPAMPEETSDTKDEAMQKLEEALASAEAQASDLERRLVTAHSRAEAEAENRKTAEEAVARLTAELAVLRAATEAEAKARQQAEARAAEADKRATASAEAHASLAEKLGEAEAKLAEAERRAQAEAEAHAAAASKLAEAEAKAVEKAGAHARALTTAKAAQQKLEKANAGLERRVDRLTTDAERAAAKVQRAATLVVTPAPTKTARTPKHWAYSYAFCGGVPGRVRRAMT